MSNIELGIPEEGFHDGLYAQIELETHLAEKARARRRRDQELTRRNVDRWSPKSKMRDNRAAGKRAFAKEVWA